jgi:hypothetical protein
MLLVEEDFHYPGFIAENNSHLLPADEATKLGVIDDAVDNIIETVLDKGGRFVFVDEDALRTHGHTAMILRH